MEERPDLRSDLLGLVGCWGVGETVEASLCPSFEVRAAAGVTAVGVLGNGLAVSAGSIQAHYLGLSRILGLMLVLCSMGRSCSSRLALSLRCWGLPAMSHHDKTKRGKCLIPEPPRRPDRRGRPWRDCREVLNGVLWILRTGAPWHDLPASYPPYQTCHRRYRNWAGEGVLESTPKVLADDLRDRGKLDLTECFIDGTFVTARRGAGTWERPSGARVARSWQWSTAMVFLSPFTRVLPARMKSSLYDRLSHLGLPEISLSG